MNRQAMAWAASVAALVACGWWLFEDLSAAGAAVIGSTIAIGAFASGIWCVGKVLKHLPGAEVPGALALFMIQLLLLVSAVLVIQDHSWLHDRAAAVGLFATALAHQIGLVRGFLRSRTLLVTSPLPDEPLP